MKADLETGSLQSRRLDRTMRLACIWAAVPMFVLFGLGMIMADIMPPPSPAKTAEEVANHYRDNNGMVRSGLAISWVSIIFFLAFGAAIAAQTRRIKSCPPVLITLQTASFAAGALVFAVPWVCWETAAFRTDRSDTEISLLHDLGWIFFMFYYVAWSAWIIAMGLAMLCDTSARPMYPRWFGYYNIFVAVSFIPDNLIVFFQTGLFAWDGIFPYWIPFALYGLWVPLCLILTIKAIKAEAADDEHEAQHLDGEAPTDAARAAFGPTPA